MSLRRCVERCSALFLSFIFLGAASCQKNDNPSSKTLLGENGLLDNVLQLVHTNYPSDVDTGRITQGAINGALQSLDDFSNYYSKEDFKTLSEFMKGQFGGIGAEVKIMHEGVEIIAPLDNSPAAKVGLRRGDIIVNIDGIPITKLKPVEILQKIHGTPGTFVAFQILRQGEELKDIKVKRELITETPVKGNLEGKIAYFRISTFNDQTAENLKKVNEELKKELHTLYGVAPTFQGVIVDLRNNPGGTLDQAILVTSLFLDKGVIVNVLSKDPSLGRTYHSQGKDLFKNTPVVVLINKGSASASEVMAGALRDHKRAILVGEKTYGKGSVQRIFDMHDKGAIKLTVAYFTTPQGNLIHEKGLMPDITVESGAREHPVKLLETETSQPLDTQKQRAIDLLQGLSVLSGR